MRRGYTQSRVASTPKALRCVRKRLQAGGSLREGKKERKKSVPLHSFPKKTASSSYVQPWLVAGGGWRLVAIGGWQLATGGWRRLVVGDWWLVAVGSGWRLAVGRRWRLAAVGGWRLVVPWGGP